VTPFRQALWETWIKPGSRVFIGGGSACPLALARSLCAHAAHLRDIELVHGLVAGQAPWTDPALADTFGTNLLFSESGPSGPHIDHTPCFASEVPGLFLEGILPLDVAIVQVTPPDTHGYCSLGTGVDLASAACRAARVVVAQINPRLPRTHGQSFIHRDRIHVFVEDEADLATFAPSAVDEVGTTIGKYLAQLVPQGATLHVGFGEIANAVLDGLRGHRDLGVHTEVLVDGFLPLLAAGAVDNRSKTIHPGKMIAASCIGSQALYDFVHDNPHVEFHPTEYVNNPAVIARNDRMVSVNGAGAVDLSGQVSSERPAAGLVGGIGGHADFFRGTTMSRGGVPIIALRSTNSDGTRSRIVPTLDDGAGVATSRGHVHYVVTEYGVATLRGRSIRERALELIQVAHPAFRDELLAEAVSRNWIPGYQRTSPRPVPDLGDVESRRLEMAGEPHLLRPLHPSDIRRLQEFFYSHTMDTIQMRYGHAVTRMTRERAYDLVNVDQSKDLALGVFAVQGPRQIIHAVGRYYLDADGRSAEVAFVVRESRRRHGMASTLLQALIDVARRRGLDSLWGRVRRDNLPMLALFKRFGGTTFRSPESSDGDVDVRIPLDASPTRAVARKGATPSTPGARTTRSKQTRKRD
jgi:acyl-CoA hydrolase/RimJ/RimL family protein N-acetyltransferase